jgi:hypothetical protein
MSAGDLLVALTPVLDGQTHETEPLSLALPSDADGSTPLPSPRIAHALGVASRPPVDAPICNWSVPAVQVGAPQASRVLERLEDLSHMTEDHLLDESSGHEPVAHHLAAADSVRYFAAAARLASTFVAEQRFVPIAVSDETGATSAAWQPWMADAAAEERITLLLDAMPPAARATIDENEHLPWPITDAFITAITDALCRDVLIDEEMFDALEDTDPLVDPHVAWLSGLLNTTDSIASPPDSPTAFVRSVRRWLSNLEDRGSSSVWQLCLRLEEPIDLSNLPDFAKPDDSVVWTLTFVIQSVDNPRVYVEAEDIWALAAESAIIEGLRLESPQDLLLSELGRASRLFPMLEAALEESAPISLRLTTNQTYAFLREIRPLLIDQGVAVEAPEWWDAPESRIGARLQLTSPEAEPGFFGAQTSPDSIANAQLGLNTLVSYEWSIAVGDVPLSLKEFEQLVAQRTPLVRIGGRWVEVRPQDLQAASEFIREHPGGEIGVAEALKLAFGMETQRAAVPILGLDATGWIGSLLGASDSDVQMPDIEIPDTFKGELRPYQAKGLSWLVFLDRLGLGPCLADDMGLGKTIQLLALMLYERQCNGGDSPGPTILVVPMSIVGNWQREAERFAPILKVLTHHGPERLTGETFIESASKSDLVITTYALVNRDLETLERVGWRRAVLDEAQNIKNPSAKQTRAVRALAPERRVALTGTPLENRLSELWSIMEFCNPGFLGTLGEFKRSFALPIERHNDRQRANRLRNLVRPFILRRLKTDPNVIEELPEKVESKEYCRLTADQAEMYESTVRKMLSDVEQTEGIRRRGAVLATLTRLKQICDHPWLVRPKDDKDQPPPTNATASGKTIRLLEMLDEVVASGDQALVFTQFRQMGRVLASTIAHALDRDVLFLHGGVTQTQRQAMVDRFQEEDGTAPIFILSLKAGGVGLNLTAASHVFHFDRWWNPAVENQATDRAYRIGQTKRVLVHKFIVAGTLEERIDQMIESKIALAEDVIGSGEDWLTELSTNQLKELFSLRTHEVVGDA